MATLILGAVGGLVGGRIGQAVGAAIGSVVDSAIFAPAPRQGPRPAELSVQTSTYGAPIPKLFGRTRVAGTVFWSTDLIEARTRQSNGKGRGSTDVYSYSASFAVMLSARRIVRIERIWADGKLLRGEAGDLKVELAALRVHTGDDDQLPDPLIAAAEGADAPAYRGAAYVVLEGLSLGDYGNRIPSLTFEVVADETAIGVGSALAELSSASAEAGPVVDGLAASGTNVRALAETLSSAFPALVTDTPPMIRFAPVAAGAIDPLSLGATSTGERASRIERSVAPAETTASVVGIGYFDPARDYQPGMQRARRVGPGTREERIDLPVVIAAGSAAELGERILARRMTTRDRASISLPWSALSLRPGRSIIVDGTTWRIDESAFEGMRVKLGLVRHADIAIPARAAEPGRGVGEIDLPHGPTIFVPVDLPPLADIAAAHPTVAVFACGATPGWRRANVLASVDGGATFADAGSTGLPSVLGITLAPVFPSTDAIEDRATTIDIQLINATDVLADADDSMLHSGANMALLGGEIVQFGRADSIGGGQWRLSRLRRGRRGTEGATTHGTNTPFVLIQPGIGLQLPTALAVPGVVAMAGGIGDTLPWQQKTCGTALRAVMPLSPVHLRARPGLSGATELGWTRRSREGWMWRDAVDVPLAEDRELYRVSWGASVTEVDRAGFTYSAAMRAADIAGGATSVTFEIVQVGALAVSPPARLTLSLV